MRIAGYLKKALLMPLIACTLKGGAKSIITDNGICLREK